MDICSLVNSKDIGNYLREINYEFSSLETAWLVYACRKLSYEEKKEYWNEIIATMPDCEMPQRFNCAGWDSLHSFLKQYMEITDAEINEFFKKPIGTKYVYTYTYKYEEDAGWTMEHQVVYPSLEACIDSYRKSLAEVDGEYIPGENGITSYIIRRQSLEDCSDVMEIEFLGNEKVAEILINSGRTEEAENIIEYSFMGLWFDFPTPFKKGDIVWKPAKDNQIKWDHDGGFVLKGLSTWEPSEYLVKLGDNSDMNGFGYFVNTDGTVYYEVMENYMDLEFYHKPYKLNEKILPALGKYIKGEIEVDLLLSAYRKTLIDVAEDDIMIKGFYYPRFLLEEIDLV